MRLYQESNREIIPACKSGLCPIEDLATDDEVTQFIEQFQLAKALARTSELPETQQKIFDDLGLLDYPEFHLELEILHMRWVNRQRQKQKGQWTRTF